MDKDTINIARLSCLPSGVVYGYR